MFTKENAKSALKSINWVEGAVVPVAEAPYRHRIVVHCSSRGRQRAEFANGEHSYFCYVEIVSENGQMTDRGAALVPVLPDGRVLMVVEQRPAQGRNAERPMIAEIGGGSVDLRAFGPDSSLEFPGGGIEPNEGLKVGVLRELAEETGMNEQTALYYGRRHMVYYFGSDLAHRNFLGVVFLSGLSYESHVPTDGGLCVFALTHEEVQRNIWSGVIHSGQAALQWAFYQEVMALRKDPAQEKILVQSGYLQIERVKIIKT